MTASVDLNADVGEGVGDDAALIPLVTSVNIACGAHAGDEATFRKTAELALAAGAAIGAHPGFGDRLHFGRRDMPVSPTVAAGLVEQQVGLALRAAGDVGGRLVHVKLHGAFYTMAARDDALADAVARAVAAIDPALVLVGLAGSALTRAGERAGLRTAHEAFADRTYQSDGSLTPRSRPDALIEDEERAVAQVLRMVTEGRVRAVDGTDVPIRADTLCLHGDGPRAVDFARRLRAALAGAGIRVAACGSPRI